MKKNCYVSRIANQTSKCAEVGMMDLEAVLSL